MIISVINHSNGKVSNKCLQHVIRSINRQLKEDFKLHWHKDVQLRLEGRSGDQPVVDNIADMRGDGILYVWDDFDLDNALGYHNLNFNGIPYGFVFIELSAEYGEHWSVTLSHEALEMAVDPEVNLYALGPHPEQPWRKVLHWYEICDAVQQETYEIDGVEVANFLLPLYFTEHEEPGSHNDFLGTTPDERGDTIRSFGLNPGGYVGFYDPETGGQETYALQGDQEAARRLAIKKRAGGTRRSIRRTMSGDGGAGDVLTGQNMNNVRPVFEGFGFVESGKEKLQKSRYKAIQEILGEGWYLENDESAKDEWEILPPDGLEVPNSQAWQWYYQLLETGQFPEVEPLFEAITLIEDAEEERGGVRASFFGSGSDDPHTERKTWAPEMVSVTDALYSIQPPDGGRARGAGVRIAHPDSGFLDHSEYRFNAELQLDFVDKHRDARGPNGNHGLSTGSVLASATNPGGIWGIAPEAELVPLRVASRKFLTPVLFFSGMRRLARSINYAVENNCQVVSISLGGLFCGKVHRAIKRAVAKDVIVVSAAGNKVGMVVWPARYKEVIAVAACNFKEKPWSGSSRGKAVDVTAPGESVWRARIEDGVERMERGDGTSYATAITAGIAALWVAFHGIDRLRAVFGEGKVVAGFQRLLVQFGCDAKPELPHKMFGAGLINAEHVIRTDLNLVARESRLLAVPRDSGWIDDIAGCLEDISHDETAKMLADLLKVDQDQLDKVLPQWGPELLFQFETSGTVCRAFTRGAKATDLAAGGVVGKGIKRLMMASDVSPRLKACLNK